MAPVSSIGALNCNISYAACCGLQRSRTAVAPYGRGMLRPAEIPYGRGLLRLQKSRTAVACCGLQTSRTAAACCGLRRIFERGLL